MQHKMIHAQVPAKAGERVQCDVQQRRDVVRRDKTWAGVFRRCRVRRRFPPLLFRRRVLLFFSRWEQFYAQRPGLQLQRKPGGRIGRIHANREDQEKQKQYHDNAKRRHAADTPFIRRLFGFLAQRCRRQHSANHDCRPLSTLSFAAKVACRSFFTL
ncbi:MAG: hypothetical protein LUF77_06180, partial [Oscillospiraceae bacterium]|nr:hypothetical protein [Oscillospiraceae bacterium]